jgi:hypothetical protein
MLYTELKSQFVQTNDSQNSNYRLFNTCENLLKEFPKYFLDTNRNFVTFVSADGKERITALFSSRLRKEVAAGNINVQMQLKHLSVAVVTYPESVDNNGVLRPERDGLVLSLPEGYTQAFDSKLALASKAERPKSNVSFAALNAVIGK